MLNLQKSGRRTQGHRVEITGGSGDNNAKTVENDRHEKDTPV